MSHITSLPARLIKWQQSDLLKTRYELRADNELVGTLIFRSTSGSLAAAQSADDCWTFKRVGFRHAGVTLRACGEDSEFAVFRNGTWAGGGTLEFSDGRRFLATTNSWQTHFEFEDENGNALVRFDTSGILRLSATVDILAAASSAPELPLLVMLGWYLMVMMDTDNAIAAASEAIRARYIQP